MSSEANRVGAQSGTRLGLRRAGAVIAAKLIATASRQLGRGGGTALPGLVATRLDPAVVRDLASQLPGGSIVVSGTNGKTTTARILASIMHDAGLNTVRNASGSNLVRGVATSLVGRASLAGTLSRKRRDLGLFEVDEAALPEILSTVVPRTLLLLDLFRDQLDRYGEVATIGRLWTDSIRALPESALVVANADDPLVASIGLSRPGAPIFFGIESVDTVHLSNNHAGDVKFCPVCRGSIEFDWVSLGHLGHYSCSCGFARPAPAISAVDVRLRGIDGSDFELVLPSGRVGVSFPLPGLYNVYNALGAAAVATHLGIEPESIARSLARASPAFGRMERFAIQGRDLYLTLAKNPTGLNQVLHTVVPDSDKLHLLVMLNDNAADGRDVSWIWDADVEILSDQVASVVFAGTRAHDMALRFKYGSVIDTPLSPPWSIEATSQEALRQALKHTPEGHRLFVIPTYTAMLDVRSHLQELGHVRAYWKRE